MMRIEFIDWHEYLTRNDLVNVRWLKIPANIINSRQMHGLPIYTKWLLIYFLCEAGNQNQKGKLDIEIDYVAHHSGCTYDEILYSVQILADRKYFNLEIDQSILDEIELESRAQPARSRTESVRTNTESVRTRTASARIRTESARIRTESARIFEEEACSKFEHINKDDHLNHSESLDFSESARIRTESARICTESARTRAQSVPREEKRREEKRRKEETESTEESPRETIFDAAGGGSLSLPISAQKLSTKKSAQVMDFSEAELELGTQWLKLAVTHFPQKATDPKWTPAEFALELRKVANVVGLSIAQMNDLLTWVKADTFWCNKVASPYGLLKKSTNGLRKIENAFASSKSKAQIRNEQIKSDWEENPEKKATWELAMSYLRGDKK